jgi:hypothetical protein
MDRTMPEDYPARSAALDYVSNARRIDELARLASESINEVVATCHAAAEACPLVLSNMTPPDVERERQSNLATLPVRIRRVEQLHRRWKDLAPAGVDPVEFLDALLLVINQRNQKREAPRPALRIAGETFETGHRAATVLVGQILVEWYSADGSAAPILAQLYRRLEPGASTAARTAIENERADLHNAADSVECGGAASDEPASPARHEHTRPLSRRQQDVLERFP